jgi:hypothetical protein
MMTAWFMAMTGRATRPRVGITQRESAPAHRLQNMTTMKVSCMSIAGRANNERLGHHNKTSEER